jgi:hypothetical protein
MMRSACPSGVLVLILARARERGGALLAAGDAASLAANAAVAQPAAAQRVIRPGRRLRP